MGGGVLETHSATIEEMVRKSGAKMWIKTHTKVDCIMHITASHEAVDAGEKMVKEKMANKRCSDSQAPVVDKRAKPSASIVSSSVVRRQTQ
jgi:divalent metal cation (Fe/Co/Zn/Cd) transporter